MVTKQGGSYYFAIINIQMHNDCDDFITEKAYVTANNITTRIIGMTFIFNCFQFFFCVDLCEKIILLKCSRSKSKNAKTTINQRRHVKLVRRNKSLPLSINQLIEVISCSNKPVSWAGCDVSNNVNVNQGIRQLTAPCTSHTCDDVRGDRHAPCSQTKESCPRQEYKQELA